MTAALKPTPLITAAPCNPKVTRGTSREISNELILDASRALIAAGLKPTAVLVAESVTHLALSSVQAYMKELKRRGLLPRGETGLKCPTMERAKHATAPIPSLVRVVAQVDPSGPPKPYAPCSRCNDPEGYRQPGITRPARHNHDGWPGKVCRACFYTLRRKQLDAEPSLQVYSPDAEYVLWDRARDIREKRTEVPKLMPEYDSQRASFREGMAEERAVAAEQAARLLTLRSEGFRLEPTAKEASRVAVERYDAAARRLKGHASYCLVSFM